jgi:hypothetical protein
MISGRRSVITILSIVACHAGGIFRALVRAVAGEIPGSSLASGRPNGSRRELGYEVIASSIILIFRFSSYFLIIQGVSQMRIGQQYII